MSEYIGLSAFITLICITVALIVTVLRWTVSFLTDPLSTASNTTIWVQEVKESWRAFLKWKR